MSYLALARKWRPQSFDDITGQDTVVRTLQNAIEQQRIHHAYLFSGVRGVGKTTAARIFAKALNCVTGPTSTPCNECSICREITDGTDLDVREIDAATYTQVDNIRELREVSQFQPARDRRRIFIIDEAHMLSAGAWNALLKLIEEPPPHVAFIMATTEVQKVPATILSRVQSLVFRKITLEDIAARLGYICEKESIEIEPAALEVLARRGEGSMRDALSILDQVVAFCGRSVRVADVTSVLGLSDATFCVRLVRHIARGETAGLLEALELAAESGRDFKLLFRDFVAFVRNVLVLTSGARETLLSAAPEDWPSLREAAGELNYSEALRILNLLLADEDMVNRSDQQRIAVEVSLLKAATLPRLRAIEDVLGGRSVPLAQASAQPAPESRRPAEPTRKAAAPPPAVLAEPGARTSTQASQEPSIASLAEALSGSHKLSASYIGQARAFRIEGDVAVFEYDRSQSFAVEYLAAKDHAEVVADAMETAWGRRFSVRFTHDDEVPVQPKSEPRASLSDDPVLRSIATHLGGEPVLARKGSKERA